MGSIREKSLWWSFGMFPRLVLVSLVVLSDASSWLPLHPWFSTDSSLLQKMQQCGDAFWVVEEMWKVLGVAIYS